MILVLAGTKDSREIIKRLDAKDYEVIASVVTDYGFQLADELGIRVLQGELTDSGLTSVIKDSEISLIVDATHPFATEISQTALKVSAQLGVSYIRFAREELDLADQSLITKVDSYQQAAKEAQQFDRILLTIGSKNLSYFIDEIEDWSTRLVARILPLTRFIKRAEDLGFCPQNLLALQGPFSKQLNQVLLEDYNIDVIVTKASGKTGGLDTKLAAARELEKQVILITRPDLSYPNQVSSYQELLAKVGEHQTNG
jgi:precorrin-6A/cobalt-precorrin-6A reductase